MADSNEDFTQKVKDGLRRLGYSKHRANLRSNIYNNAALGSTIFHNQVNRYNETLTILMTGSRREGMTGFWDSDTDQLIIPLNVFCVDEHLLDSRNIEEKTIFTLDYKEVPEGYALLKSYSVQENTPYTDIVKNDCIEKGGVLYLVNDGLIADIINVEANTADVLKTKGPPNDGASPDLKQSDVNKMLIKMANEHPHGPARPFTLRIPVVGYNIHYDNVIALRCYSKHLSNWCDSKQHQKWPQLEIIERIRKLDSYVVPIGVENTKNENLQWRISHASAETELVTSFNDIQIKVYGLMKLVGKIILEESLTNMVEQCGIEKDVPSLSYIIKNVLFWISEEETADGFTENHFNDRIKQALHKLLISMETGYLPCYVFPSRNIFTTKITDAFRKRLADDLRVLLSEGLVLVKKIPALEDQIGCPDIKKLDQKFKRQMIKEYLFIAPFTLPPEHMANVKQQFLVTKWSIQAVHIYFKEVWPYFIKTVTDDMFEEFNGRSDLRKFIHVVSEYIGFRNFLSYIKDMCQGMVYGNLVNIRPYTC